MLSRNWIWHGLGTIACGPKERDPLAHAGGRNWTVPAFFPWLHFQGRKIDVTDDEDDDDGAAADKEHLAGAYSVPGTGVGALEPYPI